jgi:hypothetical protein
MPNWITNILTINADEKMVEKILSEVKSDESEFDFNLIVPQPDELEGTTAPARIISDEEYAKDSSKGITQTMSDELISKYGFNNWYDWRYEHWGTKWNADEIHISDNEITFNTAWCNPQPLLVALSRKYPDIQFNISFADEDFGHNVGTYILKDGEEIDCHFPEGGSEDAYELALDIQGGNDYYTWDILFEANEDKELDTFFKTMVKIAYKNDKVIDNDMPLPILNEFLSLALADENYEFADKVKKAIESKEQIEK